MRNSISRSSAIFLGAVSIALASSVASTDQSVQASPYTICGYCSPSPRPSVTVRPTPTPTPGAPTPTPVPSPTPRPPTSTDLSQFQSMANSINSNHPTLTNLAIVGKFAIIYWVESPIGGGILATDASGSWKMIAHGHGSYSVGDLLDAAPQMGVPTANVLFSQAQIETP